MLKERRSLQSVIKSTRQVQRAYHLLEPKDDCKQVSISVTVEGKVKYTGKPLSPVTKYYNISVAVTSDTVTWTSVSLEIVIENYEYYDEYDSNDDAATQGRHPEHETSDDRSRHRRDSGDVNSEETVTYRVCVRLEIHATRAHELWASQTLCKLYFSLFFSV